jgi:hypothetical protein
MTHQGIRPESHEVDSFLSLVLIPTWSEPMGQFHPKSRLSISKLVPSKPSVPYFVGHSNPGAFHPRTFLVRKLPPSQFLIQHLNEVAKAFVDGLG